MKTATITYHNVYNYGALLQAYALQQAQFKLSIDNVIIDYNPGKNKLHQEIKGHSVKILIINLIRLLNTAFNIMSIKKRCRCFDEFTKQKLILTKKYLDYEELKADPPPADWYIAGSDQLWNVSISLHKAFFLDFGDSSMKRASFAVSMGSYQVPDQYRQEMKGLLKHFNAISVREKGAKDVIENMIKKENFVHVNFDPVFLLSEEEWIEFSNIRDIGSPYILCYPMSGHPLLNDALRKLKNLTGYKIVILVSEVLFNIKGDIYIKDATPEEFVHLIHKADYVMTTSFHGTAFCTIFHKKFYVLAGGAAPSRIIELLSCLGLEDRLVSNLEQISTDSIDTAKVNQLIAKEKELSLNYLLSLLSPAPNLVLMD